MSVSLRVRIIFAYLAAAAAGGMISLSVAYIIAKRAWNYTSVGLCMVATKSHSAGDDEKAIFFLGEANAYNSESAAPLILLGDLYSLKGNERLALETYESALSLLKGQSDRQWDRDWSHVLLIPAISRTSEEASISKKIDFLKKRLREDVTPQASHTTPMVGAP